MDYSQFQVVTVNIPPQHVTYFLERIPSLKTDVIEAMQRGALRYMLSELQLQGFAKAGFNDNEQINNIRSFSELSQGLAYAFTDEIIADATITYSSTGDEVDISISGNNKLQNFIQKIYQQAHNQTILEGQKDPLLHSIEMEENTLKLHLDFSSKEPMFILRMMAEALRHHGHEI